MLYEIFWEFNTDMFHFNSDSISVVEILLSFVSTSPPYPLPFFTTKKRRKMSNSYNSKTELYQIIIYYSISKIPYNEDRLLKTIFK